MFFHVFADRAQYRTQFPNDPYRCKTDGNDHAESRVKHSGSQTGYEGKNRKKHIVSFL